MFADYLPIRTWSPEFARPPPLQVSYHNFDRPMSAVQMKLTKIYERLEKMLEDTKTDGLNNELNTLGEPLNEIRRDLAKALENDKLNQEIFKRKIQRLHEINRQLEKKIQSSEKMYTNDIKEKEILLRRSTDTEKELDQLRDKIKKLEQEMERREWSRPNDTELNQLRTKVKNFEEEKIRLVGKLNRSDDIQNKMQAKINEMIEEKAQQLKRSITTEKALNRLQAKVRDIEEEKTRLEQQLNKSCDAQIEITKLRAKINKMEEERARVERQLYKTLDTERELNELRVMLENKDKEEARLTGQLNRSNDTEKELKQLRVKVNEMEVEKSRLAQQLNRSNNTEREIYQLRVKVNELEVDKATLIRQVSRSNDVETEHAELRVKVKNVEDENWNLAQQLKKMNHAEKELSQLQTKIKSMEDENARLKQQLINSKDTNEELYKNTSELKTLKESNKMLIAEKRQLQNANAAISKQRDDFLSRLSRLAGAKSTHGYTAITDLSDTDRPTKIAEKFSELYDNAWADAFEELDTTYNNEKGTIEALLKIMQEAYIFCVQTEKDYEDRINRAVFTVADKREITSTDVAVQEALADLRISLGNPCCSVFEEMFLSRLPSILKEVDVAVCPKTKIYAQQCASLCWRMRIREPPVFVRFEFRKETTFNSDILKKFTTTGGYLDFLVWPALYLYENGPLLAKGVAKPKPTP